MVLQFKGVQDSIKLAHEKAKLLSSNNSSSSSSSSNSNNNKRLHSMESSQQDNTKSEDTVASVTDNNGVSMETKGTDCQQQQQNSSKRSRRFSPESPITVPTSVTNESSIVKTDNNVAVSSELLPDPKESDLAPDVYLLALIKAMFGVSLTIQKALDLGNDYFPPPTEKQFAAYRLETVEAARENDVESLRKCLSVDCVNRFGESLLHLACRRGFEETVQYLLSDEVSINVRMKDDFGRTPLHDLCWHPKPLTTICSWIIEKEPSLLLVADKRGSTPFAYARAQDWPTWRQFLF